MYNCPEQTMTKPSTNNTLSLHHSAKGLLNSQMAAHPQTLLCAVGTVLWLEYCVDHTANDVILRSIRVSPSKIHCGSWSCGPTSVASLGK